MPQIQPLVQTRVLKLAETALALNLISDIDLLRLKTIARLHARGLPPDVDWDDLLQEAFTRVLVGSRRQPEGVTMVVFLAGIMRSLKSEHWRRLLTGSDLRQALQIDQVSDESRYIELRDPAPGPERSLSARQELTAIERLFVDDPVALQIIAGLGEGFSAEQIRIATGISKTDSLSAKAHASQFTSRRTDMRTKVKVASPEVALSRILEALERELIDASDEEIMEAAKDLGMNPNMKGSAAFAGLKYPAKPQLSDFFEFGACKNAQVEAERIANATRTQRKRNAPQSKQFEISRERKDSGDK